VGYHHSDHPGKDRSLGPSLFRVPETLEKAPPTPRKVASHEQSSPPNRLESPRFGLWTSVTDVYDLQEHESTLLREAARTADLLADLDAVIRRDGAVIDTEHGPKAHPAAVEARLQRLTLARLLSALRLPDDDAEQRPQHRGGARGFYAVKGSAS